MVARPRTLIGRTAVLLTIAAGLSAGGCERDPQGAVNTALAGPGAGKAAPDDGPLGPDGKPYEQARVKVAGRTFKLDLALDEPTRIRGLGGRDHIPEDGGMLFVFPWAQRLNFVMRDCPVPIDVLFLNQEGRVLTLHAMVPEDRANRESPTFSTTTG